MKLANPARGTAIRKSNLIRLITVLYAVALTGVVVGAGSGWFPDAFAWVQANASDKVLHFVLVGTMALLLNLSFNLKSIDPKTRWLQWGSIIMLALATAEEFSQLFFARRHFEWIDLACNYAGIILIGSLAFLIVLPKNSGT